MTDDSAHWLASVADICERAATGDLEARITGLAGSGDFSRLCSAINHMLDVADSYVRESSAVMDYCSRGQYHRPILLRGLPGSYRDGAEIINGAALKMKQDAAQIAQFEAERERVATRVLQATDSVSGSAAELESTAGGIWENAVQTKRLSSSVATSAEEAASNVSAVAAACEELTSTTLEISRQADESAKLTNGAVTQAEQAASAVKELSEAARKIESVVSLINKIARQTNLLALNATIEAARAGEHGRGFAVVATEVKVLSQNTSQATDTIADQVDAMRQATTNVMKLIEGIGASIKRINDTAGIISTSVGEQAQATAEIAHRVVEASGSTKQISTTIAAVSDAASQTESVCGSLKEASGNLTAQSELLRDAVSGLVKKSAPLAAAA